MKIKKLTNSRILLIRAKKNVKILFGGSFFQIRDATWQNYVTYTFEISDEGRGTNIGTSENLEKRIINIISFDG